MSIKYTYEIVNVDAVARCMEVVYAADGHETMHIGARLPFEDEQLEDVIRAFSPVPLWEERAKAVQVPQVGLTGTIVPAPVADAFAEVQGVATASSGEIPQAVL